MSGHPARVYRTCGVGSKVDIGKADIGAPPPTQLSFMSTRSSTPLHDFAHHTTVLRGVRLGARRAVMLEHHKRDFVDDWVEGELAELLFLKSEDSEHQRIVSKLNLEVK